LAKANSQCEGQAGAVGYLVGQPGEGLKCMFHMMNEARIGIGMAATMLGMAGYEASAGLRQDPAPRAAPWGRPAKTPPQPQVRTDRTRRHQAACCWRRKAYCEGSLALLLYCAKLVDEQHTGDARSRRRSAGCCWKC
jgi:alkylation response protein AidB-like acyl-CoA dehydrogenase